MIRRCMAVLAVVFLAVAGWMGPLEPAAAQSPTAGLASPAPRIVGHWNWVAGQTLEIRANGIVEVFQGLAKINEGRWESLGGDRY